MLYDDDTIEHEGLRFRVTFPYDDDATAPWDREDGHGPVSECRDEASGIARAWREGREFGHDVAAVWAEAV